MDMVETEPMISAPVSGSTIAPAWLRCCCCSAGVGDDPDVGESGGEESRDQVRRVGSQTRQTTTRQGRVPGVRDPLRRLPCGHHAHDSCLIPIILEGLGRGHPASCSCPLDSSPMFPSLERRAIRGDGGNKRRRWCGSNERVRGTDGVRATAEQREQSGLIVEGARATPVSGTSAVQHAGVAAGRGTMLRNRDTSDNSSSRNSTSGADVLGIVLVGSGLHMTPASAHAEAASKHAESLAEETAPVATIAAPGPHSQQRANPVQYNRTRTVSAHEARSVRRFGVFRGSGYSDSCRGESAYSGDTRDISGISSAAQGNSRLVRNLRQSASVRAKRVVGRRLVPACAVRSLLGRGKESGSGESGPVGGKVAVDTAAFDDRGNRSTAVVDSLDSSIENSLGFSLQSVRLTAAIGGTNRRSRVVSHENRPTAVAADKPCKLVLAASSGSGNTTGSTIAGGEIGASIRIRPRAGDGDNKSSDTQSRTLGPANFGYRRPIVVPTAVSPRFGPSEEHSARGGVGGLEATINSVNLD